MKQKPLNRDTIKYIAIITMTLNHIGYIFLKPGSLPATALIDIGYFTAPVMCFFLVEGYRYTRSRKRYGLRLALFALLSEIPYCLAFSKAYTEVDTIAFCGFNMIFTLFLCFLVLLVRDHVRSGTVKTVVIVLLFILSTGSDWGVLAPAFTLLFAWAEGSEKKLKKSFWIAAGLFILSRFYIGADLLSTVFIFLYSLGGAIGVLIAGFVIVYLYNGKRTEKGRQFSKWFFYFFYPVHLLILGLIRLSLL